MVYNIIETEMALLFLFSITPILYNGMSNTSIQDTVVATKFEMQFNSAQKSIQQTVSS